MVVLGFGTRQKTRTSKRNSEKIYSRLVLDVQCDSGWDWCMDLCMVGNPGSLDVS